MFGWFEESPKPIPKCGSKRLDNKVEKALKKSGGLCANCKKRKRVGAALWCYKCLPSYKQKSVFEWLAEKQKAKKKR